MLGIGVFAALVAVNAFFVGAEFSMLAVDTAFVEHLAEEGDRSAIRLLVLLHQLTFHLSGAQVGITVMSILLGFVAEPTVARLVEPLVEGVVGPGGAAAVSVGVALAIATMAHTVLGEQVPKYVALAKPSIALNLSPAISLWGAVARPIIAASNSSANWVVRRLGREPREDLDTTLTLGELGMLVQTSGEGGGIEPEEVGLLTRSIRFVQKHAAEAMVPRPQVAALEEAQSVTDLVAAALDTGFSRFPVYGEDLDDIVGVVHVKSVAAVPRGRRSDTPVTEVMGDVLAVGEACELERVFFLLREGHLHMAVVVDEHGGTAGIITLEDILEEIVGEIADEFDEAEADVPWVEEDDGAFVLPASLHPHEVLDATTFEIPEGEYETAAGFVLERLGHIPEPGEFVDHDGWRIEVSRVEGVRITEVRLERREPPGTRPDGEREAGS